MTRLLEPGTVLHDRYTIRSLLGAGGMGTVYRAHDAVQGRDVAIKIPFVESDEKNRVAYLIQESETLAKIDSPHIPKAIEKAELPDGGAFFSMELAEGRPLSDLVKSGELPAMQQRIEWLREIASALKQIHDAGFLYCDLKPENIMAAGPESSAPGIKIIDFGIARPIGSTEDRRELAARGTTEYMSPEQHRNLPLDVRSDVYSFGVLGFELLTGQRPYRTKENVSEVAKATKLTAMHIKGRIPSARELNPEVPRDLDVMLQVCLQKEKTERFDSMQDVLDCLATVNGSGVLAHVLAPMLRRLRGLFSGNAQPHTGQ